MAAVQAQERRAVRPVPRVRPSLQILVKGGTVLSLDPKVGDFDTADVLIEGETHRRRRAESHRRADAQVIDASHAIVMPGFIDTHRHMWEGSLRNILPNGLLSDYTRDITGAARAAFRPEDAHAGDLVSALGAINAGVTTVLDWSHIGNSPEHTDAAIAGLRESGIRAVYAYGGGTPGPQNKFPQDIRRLRRQYFSSNNQLLTLAMAAGHRRGGLGRRARRRRADHAARQRRGHADADRGSDETGLHLHPLRQLDGSRSGD